MAGNEVLVKFDGDNSGLKKSAKGAEDAIDGVKGASDEADQSIKKTGDSGTTAGEKIGKGFKIAGVAAAAAAAAATAVVVKLVSESIKAYADFEQLSGGMQKIFNEVDYSKIAGDANKAYATMNLSANDYMKNMAGVGAMFAASMGDQKGYDSAKKGMQAIADYASGTGVSVDNLMEKYQAISKATTSYLSIADQFSGILPATSADFLAQAQAAGFLGDQYKVLTDVPVAEYQDAISSMLEKGVKDQGLLGNTIAETAGTISGSLAATKAAWQNTMASFGSGDDAAIATALNGFVESAGNFVTNISKILPNIISGIVTLLDKLIPEIPGLFDLLLPPLIEGVVSVLDGLVKAIPGLIKVLIKIIPDLVDGFVKVFVSIIDALPEIIAGLLTLFNAIATALLDPKIISSVITALMTAVLGIIDAIVKYLTDPKALTTIITGAITLLMAIVKAIPTIIIALVKAIPIIIQSLVDFFTNPTNLLMIFQAMITLGWEIIKAIPLIIVEMVKAFGAIIGGIGGVFEKIPGVISKIWDKVVEWVKGVPDKIVAALSGIGDKMSGIFTGAWDGLKSGFKTVVNWIIKGINTLIKGANKAIEWIPGVDNIPEIPLMKAQGGYIGHVTGRGSGTSDSIPAMLSNGEYVVKAAAVRNIGVDTLDVINQGGMPQSSSPIVGEMNVYKDTDPLVLAQQIGSLVRFA